MSGVDDYTLRKHAMARRLVKLTDGRIATLVSWPGNQRRKGRYCRLETSNGSRFTVRCDRVEAMDVEGTD